MKKTKVTSSKTSLQESKTLSTPTTSPSPDRSGWVAMRKKPKLDVVVEDRLIEVTGIVEVGF
jgi:hypothetical protein